MTEPYVPQYAGQTRTYTWKELYDEFLEDVRRGDIEFLEGATLQVISDAANMYADEMWEFLIEQISQTIDQRPYSQDEVKWFLEQAGKIEESE
jgi:hypothetical protein